MNGLELKKILYNNPEYIEQLLSDLGCEHITQSGKNIYSTRPEGRNSHSVHIKLKELLPSRIYTRQSEFESKYSTRDILELVQFFKNDCNIFEAMKYICQVCGIDCDISIEVKPISASMAMLKKIKKVTSNDIIDDDTPISTDILDNFLYYPSYDFYKDNIDVYTQMEFGVCYDIINNRVCFPIYNSNGDLLTVKGRTLDTDYKIKGIPKYLYYEEYIGGNHLYGEWENKNYIKEYDSLVILEAEKSCLQLASYGYRNGLATCKKTITRQQLLRLLKYGKDIVIAYDNDVSDNEILLECSKFKGLINVYYIRDKFGLLGKKDSPSDKGKEVFEELLRNKIKYER